MRSVPPRGSGWLRPHATRLSFDPSLILGEHERILALEAVRFWLSSQRSHNAGIQARGALRRSISQEPDAIADFGGVREDACVRVVFVLNPQLNSVYKASRNPG